MSTPLIVWVVERGQYSDRHVEAITDSEDKARAVAELSYDGRYYSVILNEAVDRLLQGYRRWEVVFEADTSEALEVRQDWTPTNLLDEPEAPYVTSYPNFPSAHRDVLVIQVDARDEVEAVKIASEKRVAYLLAKDLQP